MEVHLIDVMGDDLRVVNSARVSFSKESEWETTTEEFDSLIAKDFSGQPFKEGRTNKILSEQDQKLISYLAKHNHWTPFSHVQITMREKVPIFVARQRFKHMVGFTYNEISRRYVSDTPEFFVPLVWRAKPEGSVKQGSSDQEIKEIFYKGQYIQADVSLKVLYQSMLDSIEKTYESMIEGGVAPEQARMVLPQSMYTEYFVTGSLAAWARAYKLRIDGHAQKEIQDLAKMWGTEISKLEGLKHSWKALTK